MKRLIVSIAIVAFTFTFATVQPVMAKDGAGKKSGNVQSSDSHDSVHHDSINSGRDFGQHVKEMNKNFSGDHNPGKHHKGYSGIKD